MNVAGTGGRDGKLFVREDLIDGRAPEIAMGKRLRLRSRRPIGVFKLQDDLVGVVDELGKLRDLLAGAVWIEGPEAG